MCRALLAAVCAIGALVAATSAAAAPAPPHLTVRAAALLEESTGQRLYGLNDDSELPIASTTKLMTALLTLEHTQDLGTLLTQNNYYPAGTDSQIGLVPGERMSVRDLLLAMLLPSADDAAEDLADHIGGRGVPYFIAMMNVRAVQLGLTHTHYSTPIGLDTPGNYSSAWDLVTLAGYVLRTQPFFRSTVAQRSAVLRTGDSLRVVRNLNDLIGRVPWVNGVKTGHTADAGYVVVASGTKDGMTLIGAVLGAASQSARDANALALLNYGFRNFVLRAPVRAGSLLAHSAVRGRPNMRATVLAGESFARVFARTTQVAVQTHVPRELTGPLRRGAVVGSVQVTADGQTIASIPLLLARSLPPTPQTVLDWIGRPFTLVWLLPVGAAIALTMIWRGRKRGSRAADRSPA